MRKFYILAIILCLFTLPCNAKKAETTDTLTNEEKQVFIYHIPDDEEQPENAEQEKNTDIVSDDVTADTSQPSEETNSDSNEEIISTEDDTDDDYELSDMYSDVLQGYAEYNEDDNAIILDEYIDKYLTLNIRKPISIKSSRYSLSQKLSKNSPSYMYNNLEYNIKPIYASQSKSFGRFSAGTKYSQDISSAELEQATSIFSRYDTKHFALSTTFERTLNSTNSNYNDTFYITPELKINQYFSLKENMSTDLITNRKKLEFIMSITPFGYKDYNRLKFELGASTTFDESSTVLKNQLKFSTKFQL